MKESKLERFQMSLMVTEFEKAEINNVWEKIKNEYKGNKSSLLIQLLLDNVNSILGGYKTLEDIKRNKNQHYRDFVLKLAKKGTFKNGTMYIQLEEMGLPINPGRKTMEILSGVMKLIKEETPYILEVKYNYVGCVVVLKEKVHDEK